MDFVKEDILYSNNRLLFIVLSCTLDQYLLLLSIKTYPNLTHCVTKKQRHDCCLYDNECAYIGPNSLINISLCYHKLGLKTTRIIHHNQLLLTKFEKDLCHIEPMTSKVWPAADY